MSGALGGGTSAGGRRRTFAAWALATWVILLLAAFAGVQYARHADWIYLAAALGVIAACAGAILRQAWARGLLQLLCVLLAVWTVVTGVWMAGQWDQFALARARALAQPQAAALWLWQIARDQRTWQVALGLKAAAVPLLGWLAWTLGRPAVRGQFHGRR